MGNRRLAEPRQECGDREARYGKKGSNRYLVTANITNRHFCYLSFVRQIAVEIGAEGGIVLGNRLAH
jgi:hypothetical protein